MTTFYNRKGEKLPDVIAWAQLQEDRDYVRVMWTDVTDRIKVSTIWQGFSGDIHLTDNDDDVPPIFETAVLKDGTITDTLRTHTEEAARFAHEQIANTLSIMEGEDDGGQPTGQD